MHALSEQEQSLLLKEFPRVELSYETNVHKKVYNSPFVLAIPSGQKCFAWFTTFKTQNVCILLEISENKRISRINMISVCFHQKLSYGTILYGTLFKCNNVKYFSSEDIYFYKGRDVSKLGFLEKMGCFKTIYSSEIKQVSYFNNNVIFGLPVICSSYEDLMRAIDLLPYKIKTVQFRYTNAKICSMLYVKSDIVEKSDIIEKSDIVKPNQIPVKEIPRYKNDSKREVVFKIKPDIQNDIYHLYYDDNTCNDKLVDIACIPDYKTSVMMNKLFRNIKENANLDALEESDDEEEFENDSPDKFVFLDKTYNMVCTWNFKFKKWTPIRLAQPNDNMITRNELSRYNY